MGKPSATSWLLFTPGGKGGIGNPSATSRVEAEFPGGSGGIGNPSADKTEPGGNGGMGKPSATGVDWWFIFEHVPK